MGKSRRTYRNYVSDFETEWETFRRALRQQHAEAFDQVMEKVHLMSMAGGAQDPPNPQWAMVFSALVGLQLEVNELREQVERE